MFHYLIWIRRCFIFSCIGRDVDILVIGIHFTELFSIRVRNKTWILEILSATVKEHKTVEFYHILNS